MTKLEITTQVVCALLQTPYVNRETMVKQAVAIANEILATVPSDVKPVGRPSKE
jgi:hypothetical protein